MFSCTLFARTHVPVAAHRLIVPLKKNTFFRTIQQGSLYSIKNHIVNYNRQDISAKLLKNRSIGSVRGPLLHLHDDGLDATRETVPITFINSKGEETLVNAVIGNNLLAVAHKHKIPLEGACECSIACSTCHVYLEDEIFDELESQGLEACDDEEDMLDLAFGLKPTSRLGCCVNVDRSHSGMKVFLPAASRNFYVDGFVPEPH